MISHATNCFSACSNAYVSTDPFQSIHGSNGAYELPCQCRQGDDCTERWQAAVTFFRKMGICAFSERSIWIHPCSPNTSMCNRACLLFRQGSATIVCIIVWRDRQLGHDLDNRGESTMTVKRLMKHRCVSFIPAPQVITVHMFPWVITVQCGSGKGTCYCCFHWSAHFALF